MYCVFVLFASLLVCQVNSEPIERIILDYFKSESVRKFRKEWDSHRKSMEHAITTAMKETVGLAGMNVYIRKRKEKLAVGYYHNDNQVRLILKDLNLEDLPRCWLPEVQFSLASNVLKIQTTLSKMIIHAQYALVRNKTDIIYEPKDQNPFKSSPFLFQQVPDIGNVAISLDGCMLTGFIIAMLNGESVNLGYDYFKLINCQYTLEIYKAGEESPPVIAKYNPYREENGLSITHLLMKPIGEDLMPKLQAAMFSFMNTSSMFGELRKFRENQEVVFKSTWQYLTELVRNLNKLTIERNNGVITMQDYIIHWDDGRVKPNATGGESEGETLTLRDMVLTGLDTAYAAHSGGPYKMNTVFIADEIRLSSVQVRGYVEVKSSWTDKYAFAAEISDLVVDFQLDMNLGQVQQEKNNEKSESAERVYKKLEVTGLRRMVFTVPSVIFGSAESLVGGYLLSEVPKLIKCHLTFVLPKALHPPKKIAPPAKITNTDVSENTQSETDTEDSKYSEYEELAGERGRGISKKSKKRFKSINRLRSRRLHRGGKHEADNQIRKK